MTIFFILLIYVVTMLALPLMLNNTFEYPNLAENVLSDLNATYFSVFHLPSGLFIGLSMLILLGNSKDKNTVKKVTSLNIKTLRKELHEAQDIMNSTCRTLEEDKTDISSYKRLISQSKEDNVAGKLSRLFLQGGTDDHAHIVLKRYTLSTEKNSLLKTKQFGFIATLLPLLGMAGTITGLMFIFAGDMTGSASAEDSFNQKFAGMGIALLTTLYATILTAMYLKPRQHKVQMDLANLLLAKQEVLHDFILLKNTLDINQLMNQFHQEQLEEQRATLAKESYEQPNFTIPEEQDAA
ncbi:MotA/TolQ/ExbB proton channel family protein [Vibrio sp.]|nr:MotA/TolQ/ExbB proton channel family protein [Vibrio sp.]